MVGTSDETANGYTVLRKGQTTRGTENEGVFTPCNWERNGKQQSRRDSKDEAEVRGRKIKCESMYFQFMRARNRKPCRSCVGGKVVAGCGYIGQTNAEKKKPKQPTTLEGRRKMRSSIDSVPKQGSMQNYPSNEGV